MKKSEMTRNNILQTATYLFSRQGYSATSTKDIAQKAGVSEGTLFKYYGSKEGLFNTIILLIVDEIKRVSIKDVLQLVNQSFQQRPLYSSLHTLLENRLRFLEKHDTTIKAILQEMLVNEKLKKQITSDVWIEIHSTLEKLFNKAILNGEIKPIETDTLISSFISLVMAPVLASYVRTSYKSAERKRLVFKQFEFFYDSIKQL